MNNDKLVDDIVSEYIKSDPISGRDYIVQIRLKYNHEKEYRFTNELIYHTDDPKDDQYCWLYDWYEGEQDVYALGIIAVDDIKEFEPISSGIEDWSKETLESSLKRFDETIQQFIDRPDNWYGSLIVRVRYKRADETEWHYRNEFLEFNGNELKFEWTHQWMTDDIVHIDVVGLIYPDDITEFTFL